MNPKSLASLAATLVFFAAALVSAQGQRQGQGNTVSVDIVIGPGSSDDCVVTGSPEDIQSAKRNFKVVWNVTNDCEGRRTVTVDNFKHENDENRRKEPVRIDRVDDVDPGGTGQIDGRIKGAAELGTYKYDILIDGVVAEDPKLDIDG